MDLQAFLAQMNSGKRVAAGSPARLAMHRLAREALIIAARMNAGYPHAGSPRGGFCRADHAAGAPGSGAGRNRGIIKHIKALSEGTALFCIKENHALDAWFRKP
ncbi:hypothetical protein [Pseudoramibacter alactolyticus]|uniref:hypothetical protein n=1 Tax=Pseudoramibacter alactolyticus TaxID=113287 RepID=UPI0028D8DC3F|nr:hypothetical protein [Pseudoramibacter alactolyticus]